MHRIYLIFSQTYTFPSRMIRIFTRKPYSHVSLSFDDRFDQMYSFGRRNVHNFLIGGFVRENIHEGVFAFNKKAHCAIYSLPISQVQSEKIRQFIDELEQKNYGYNFLGAFVIPLHISLRRSRKYYCTEFIRDAFRHAEIIDNTTKIRTPDHLMRLGNLNPYYQGSIVGLSKKP